MGDPVVWPSSVLASAVELVGALTQRPYDARAWKCWPPCRECSERCVDTRDDPRPMLERWLEWRSRKEGLWVDEEAGT